MMKDIYICHGCDYHLTSVPPCIVICPGMEPDACIIAESDPQRKPGWRLMTDEERRDLKDEL
jgi:hypothetical protein